MQKIIIRDNLIHYYNVWFNKTYFNYTMGIKIFFIYIQPQVQSTSTLKLNVLCYQI
jgi:hypothetical protein